jgi:hypothetical protein
MFYSQPSDAPIFFFGSSQVQEAGIDATHRVEAYCELAAPEEIRFSIRGNKT